MSLLKEECQAFGVVVSQSISKKDACVNPTISVPLAALTPEGELRQSDEFSRRNFLLREANTIKHIHTEDTTWLVDGLAAVRASNLIRHSESGSIFLSNICYQPLIFH